MFLTETNIRRLRRYDSLPMRKSKTSNSIFFTSQQEWK
jgi:hypothetical protein